MLKSNFIKHPIFIIAVAFVFSFAMRLIYVEQFYEYENMKHNGEFMLNNVDGYYWAEGARDILQNHHESKDLSPIDSAPAILAAMIVKFTPLSLESVIFYFPAFFGSLIVIPLILIGMQIKKIEVGFAAALIASIAWSYYNRTMVGYFDTDALNIVFPLFMIWSIILYFETFSPKFLLFTALEIISYRWWYPASYSLEVAFFGLVLIYCGYLFYKKDKEKLLQSLKLASIMIIAMLWLPEILRILGVVLLYLVFRNARFDKFIYYILGLAIILFLATGGFEPIIFYLKNYIFKSVGSLDSSMNLKFYNVISTIKEASSVNFVDFANRISGNVILFTGSLAGLVLLFKNHKILLFSLPLLGLGFLAYGIPNLVASAGLRFTIYAVPVFALGAAYAIFLVSKELSTYKNIQNKVITNMIFGTLLIGFLTPNILHIQSYLVGPVFEKQEIEALEKLKKISSRDDYVMAWWDYGYPIRFFSDTKTFVDGGKHSGDNNYPASFCLIQNQEKSAKMARLAIEFTELGKDPRFDVMRPIIESYKLKNPNVLSDLFELKELKMPQKTSEIYLYLPLRSLEILSTIALFSNIDLETGAKLQDIFFESFNILKNDNGMLFLEDNMILDLKNKTFTSNGSVIEIKKLIIKNKSESQTFDISPNGINLIYSQDLNKIIALNDFMLKSTYAELFLLDKADNKFFEQVISNDLVKIYKLKI